MNPLLSPHKPSVMLLWRRGRTNWRNETQVEHEKPKHDALKKGKRLNLAANLSVTSCFGIYKKTQDNPGKKMGQMGERGAAAGGRQGAANNGT